MAVQVLGGAAVQRGDTLCWLTDDVPEFHTQPSMAVFFGQMTVLVAESLIVVYMGYSDYLFLFYMGVGGRAKMPPWPNSGIRLSTVIKLGMIIL